MTVQQTLAVAAEHHRAGRLAEAEAIYRQVLAGYPKQVDALHLLGVIACQQGRYEIARDLITQAIVLAPGAADFHGNLGLVLFRQGKVEQAALAYRRAVSGRPDNWPAWLGLGDVLAKMAAWTEAIEAYRRAIALNPDVSAIHHNLAKVLAYTGDYDGAIGRCEKAIALAPGSGDAYVTLGAAWLAKGDLDQAAAAYRKALELKPNRTDALSNLGNVYKETGQIGEAIKLYDRVLQIDPTRAHFDSNRLYAMHFDSTYDAQALLREHRGWADRHARPGQPFIAPHENGREAGRRLRIGFVSPDFRRHVVGWNLLPLFREYDREQFEFFCYYNSGVTDEVTSQLRSAASGWREIMNVPDSQAAALIRADRIDILVDLSLHMAGNRLLLFNHKPAPIQVTYLGYCSTTGLDTVAFRFSDPHLDPPESDLTCYSETTIRLPVSYWCYQPGGAAPAVTAAPALSGGGVTFGCLNSFSKVSPQALRLWSEILIQTPGSKILLHCSAGSHRQRVIDQFAATGVTADRVDFAGLQSWQQYMESYQRIDIAMDPFPYGGGITTCDALWMGVPVVTLTGQTAVGRGGRSILSQIGMSDFITFAPADYVRKACDTASNPNAVNELRTTLRDRMVSSPLMDAKRFAGDIQAAFRKIWISWLS